MVIYKKGDLLEAPEDIIAHGCNAVGGFGSGVAGQIAKKWPIVRDEYLDEFSKHTLDLGEVYYVRVNKNILVANCITQQEYLPRGVCHANYDAILDAMINLKKFAKVMNYSIAIPKIGCGLAGGDWNKVEKILEVVFHDYNVTVYEK